MYANAFNLVKPKNLLFGKGLSENLGHSDKVGIKKVYLFKESSEEEDESDDSNDKNSAETSCKTSDQSVDKSVDIVCNKETFENGGDDRVQCETASRQDVQR